MGNDALKFWGAYENKLLIDSAETIPNKLNFDFLKDNLSGTYFIENVVKFELKNID